MSILRHVLLCVLFSVSVGIVLVSGATLTTIQLVPLDFETAIGTASKTQVLDRSGVRLNSTYANSWNLTDLIPIRDVPDLLVEAFVCAEDKRFFRHRGQDWKARLAAVYANVSAWSNVRGGSTISEQVVRMIHERPRTLWSRWVEGWEAVRLEQRFSKWEILEFYINHVPYASNRRGIVQAARQYFNRDLTSLNDSEILALAVMIRAPSLLEPDKDAERLQDAVRRLRTKLNSTTQRNLLKTDRLALDLQQPELNAQTPHFVRYVQRQFEHSPATVRSTLDVHLQGQLQRVLDSRLDELQHLVVRNSALLVVDAREGEVLAWVNSASSSQGDRSYYDTVLLKRQPGSTLKPFLYADALEKGWTAATRIPDTPLVERVTVGLHHYRNYSNLHYGEITLRNALGNSLNIPAVRTLRYVGGENFLTTLKRLGLLSLAEDSDFYGGGLALGNGEVSLFELVRAYTALANRGLLREVSVLQDSHSKSSTRRVYSSEVASLITDILSDSSARELEFGSGVLNFPYQTAIKTGTSTAFRDSWAIGYNDRYIVGAWMGNLNGLSMKGVTGSIGPAIAVRTAFDILNRKREPTRLWLSPQLKSHTICSDTGFVATLGDTCKRRSEYFIAGTLPLVDGGESKSATNAGVEIVDPIPNLKLAIDPRIPRTSQAYEFVLDGVLESDHVVWNVDGSDTSSNGSRFLWNLSKGSHVVQATVYRDEEIPIQTEPVSFVVY